MAVAVTHWHPVDWRRWSWFISGGLQVEGLSHAHLLRVAHALGEEPRSH